MAMFHPFSWIASRAKSRAERRPARQTDRSRPRRLERLGIEALETRPPPANHSWTGPAGTLDSAHANNWSGGVATLTAVGNVTNDGTSLLQSINNNYAETLTTGSNTLTNAADGTIQTAFGGPKTISGTLANQGLVTVTNNAILTIQGNYYAA